MREGGNILLANGRLPLSNYGDLNAQLGALDLGGHRLDALFGDVAAAAAMAEIRARAGRQMRALIADLPDGSHAFEDHIDGDGRTALKAAVAADVAEPLGLGVVEAAEAVVKVAISNMAGAIRLVSIERGHDPKAFAAMPFGGGGALHVGALIRDTGLASALVPRFPGVTSALGCVIADMRYDFVHTVNRPLEALDVAALDREMAATAAEGLALLRRSGAALERMEVRFELDMSYVGQTHTVPVPLPAALGGRGTDVTLEMIEAAFRSAYERAYGRLLDGIGARLLSLRVAAVGVRRKFDLRALGPDGGARLDGALIGRRPVWWEGGWRDAAVYDRQSLPAGARLPGPAILEQSDATTFVDPGLEAGIDRYGNAVVTVSAAPPAQVPQPGVRP